MSNFLLTWLISAFSLLITAKLVPGLVVSGVIPAAIAAIVLGLANAIVKPILVVLTLPLTIITLGLFLFVVNALTFWIVGSVTPGFKVEGFIPALLGSVVLTLISSLLNNLLK
ncbi:membrane protein [Neosynechococcus sphagnicola sy1]|uniref:Membrane protein n=1 Tax=Neosynechococcus sphagnicola sy1 TaxID=1497020 RepID=A0A098TM49_9CYAN|nr:phage holin family protein [Neosynechococcus sphagnicola]KGF73384.1 membrane protein [Neosynechococcus sphagnicola sy1]